jgi:hypothetical protein
MSEECADCGAVFASPAELVRHMNEAHAGGDAKASLAMNPESGIPGYECLLCGARFARKEELAAHNLRPHYRSQPAGSHVSA